MQRPLTASEQHQQARAGKGGGLRETLKTVVYAVVIAIAVRTLAFEPFNIPSGSMKPTLLVGDYLFVSKFAYGYSRYSFPFGIIPFDGRIFGGLPDRGDVAVFKKPSDNKTDYIKRVVGLPGDRVQVVQGTLHINGAPVPLEAAGTFAERALDGSLIRAPQFVETLPGDDASHVILDIMPAGFLDMTRVFEVPPGSVFVMGDNRDNSQDSRTDEVGFVPVENLIGRAEVIFFSVDGATLLRPWSWPFEIRYGRFFDRIR